MSRVGNEVGAGLRKDGIGQIILRDSVNRPFIQKKEIENEFKRI